MNFKHRKLHAFRLNDTYYNIHSRKRPGKKDGILYG